MSRARLLLVSPAFHDYWRALSGAFTRLGYAVTTHLNDELGPAGRIREKLVVELPQRLGRPPGPRVAETRAAAHAIERHHPDVLLVVKGDRLGGEFWEAASRVPRRALWLYDELSRTEHTSATLSAAGPIASYSPHDVAHLDALGLTAVHVPLAHDPETPVPARPPSPEIVFVGARYPKREAILLACRNAGLPLRVHGRDWSDHPLDRARTWRLRSTGLPAGRDLSRADAYGVMAAAAASLNIHGDQDGFTMRTFEIPGVGGLELIDRPDVSQHYDPGREVLVFETADEAADLCRRALAEPTWARAIREAGRRRTLAEHTFDHRVATLESLWA